MTRYLKWLWGLLGSAGSAAVLISLIENAGQLQLVDALGQYLEFYRSTLRLLVDWIPFPQGWHVPQWYLDSFALNGIVSASTLRTVAVTYGKQPVTFAVFGVLGIVIPGGALLVLVLAVWFGVFWIQSADGSREYLARLTRWQDEMRARGTADPSVYDEHIVEAQAQIAEASRLRFGPLIFVGFVGVTLAVTFAFFALDALLKAQGLE